MSFFHTLTHTEDDGTPLNSKIPMKQNVEWEMDHYRVYLLGHLRDHYFPNSRIRSLSKSAPKLLTTRLSHSGSKAARCR